MAGYTALSGYHSYTGRNHGTRTSTKDCCHENLSTDHFDSGRSDCYCGRAGGVNYLQIENVWKLSPLSPKANQARSDENLRNAKAYTCQSLPDGRIDGVAVANYRTRTETEDAVVESKIAISKVSGLAIEVDNDFTSGGSSKSHYGTRYSYTGVHAAPLQK
jgi:hypothetical protein